MRLRLMPRKLQSRLVLTYVLVTLLGLGGLMLWTGLRLQAAVLERGQRDLEVQALLLAHALSEPLEEWREGKGLKQQALGSLVRSSAQSAGAQITVLDPSWRILLSSDHAVVPGVERERSELVAVQRGSARPDIRWDERRRGEWLLVAAPVMGEAGEVEGIVQLSVPMAPLVGEIRRTWMSLLTSGGGILAVTVLASLLLAHQVTEPIRRLTTVTEAIAAGELEQKVTPAGPEEIKRLGRAFNRMADQVRAMLARQRAFVANAAHELRSPLASLQLRIEMLQRHGLDDAALAQHYLGHMEQEVAHLRRLIDHLLTLSRLDEGVELPRSPVDLAPMLYELADEVTALAQAAGVRLQVDVPAHLPAVPANVEAMHIVVRNLMDNAITYTPPGGLVTLRARSGERPRGPAVEAEVGDGGPSGVVVLVSDTGPGIAAEHLPHIFERFYRVDKARSRRQGGVGLGLALVRSLVETHGGRVSVESVVGQGTTFIVRLPLSEPCPTAGGVAGAWQRRSLSLDKRDATTTRRHTPS